MFRDYLRKNIINVFVFSLFLAAAISVYFSILNDAFIGDDYSLINLSSRAIFPDLSPLFQINNVSMRPLAFSLLWLQNLIFGIEPLPSHIFSVLIHAGNAFLLFWFLYNLRVSKVTAYMAALLFLLTPIAPEAVTWSTVRFDTLVLFFMLLTLGLYAKFLIKGKVSSYLGAVAATAAAIFSKETAITLLVYIPVMDLLLGNLLSDTAGSYRAKSLVSRINEITIRFLPFGAVVGIYCIIRYFAIGKFISGYPDVPFIGKPTIHATAMSAWTMIAPLNDGVFSKTFIFLVGVFFTSIVLASLVVIIIRWRGSSELLRRVWLFFVFFSIFSLMPGFYRIFMLGAPHNLRDSRYLYISMMGFIVFTVIGIFEFGWKNRIWHAVEITLIVLVIPVSIVGLIGNNTAWEYSARISEMIPRETRRLLPDPAPRSKLYFTGVPEWKGAYLYVNGLRPAVLWEFDRNDLEVFKIDYGQEIPYGENIYLFSYDEENQVLSLNDR